MSNYLPRAALRVLGVVLLVVATTVVRGATSEPSALWVAGSDTAYKVSNSTGEVLFSIIRPHQLETVTVDQQTGNIWLYGQGTVAGYSNVGTSLIDISVTKWVTGGRPSDLVIDESNGDIWLGINKELYQFSVIGQHKNQYKFPHPIDAVTLADDSVVYVAAKNQVFVASGTQMPTVMLDLGAAVTIHDMEFDNQERVLWIAMNDRVRRFDTVTGRLTADVMLNANTSAIALSSDGAGGLWVATHRDLIHVNSGGAIAFMLQPFAGWEDGVGGQGGTIVDLIANPLDQSAWIATTKRLKHFSASSAELHDVSFEIPSANSGATRRLDMYADTLPPSLIISVPQAGDFLASNKPSVKLSYFDAGSGVDTASIELAVDGEEWPFACTADDTTATCTPVNPLPEGYLVVTASISDLAGNVSEADSVAFTVDTIPPEITVTSPVDGAYTNQSPIEIHGSLSESAELTINGLAVSVAVNHQFSHVVALVDGENSFSFLAKDNAGNASERTLMVMLDTLPPESPNLSALATSVADSLITITGTAGSAEGNSFITLTNLRTGETITVAVAADGSFTAAVTGQAGDTVEIFSTDQAGNQSAAQTLSTGGTLPPDPATVATPLNKNEGTPFIDSVRFLFAGTHPVQFEAQETAMDPVRLGVVRGRVLDRSGFPLPGVEIRIKDHAEYGYTLSRADGVFDLAVNGGGTVTLEYRKEGFLPAQRKVELPWQEYRWAEDVLLSKLDSKVSIVPAVVGDQSVVVRGSRMDDLDGARTATVMFMPGTQATFTMPDGSTYEPEQLSVRITEYTAGDNNIDAMPSPLPPSSAYTYAVEISVDEALAVGATSVNFNQPLPFYLDNFLNARVGTIVPIGWYDFQSATWKPQENGHVIKILGVNTDGLAEIDLQGDDLADPDAALAQWGIVNEERRALAQLYEAGKTIWRSRTTHFTAFDHNYTAFLPPENISPDVPDVDPGSRDVPEPDECDGCIIEPQNQVLRETIALTGSEFTLNYSSDRAPGPVPRTIKIPMSGSSLPPKLHAIKLEVTIAGKIFQYEFEPAPNREYEFSWDGVDAYGRPIMEDKEMLIRVGFEYPLKYVAGMSDVPIPEEAFAEAEGYLVDLFDKYDLPRTHAYRTQWKHQIITVPGLRELTPPSTDAGGWSINAHHYYDAVNRVLHMGNGKSRRAVPVDRIIERVIGQPNGGSRAEGISGLDTTVFRMEAMDVNAAGELHYVDGWTVRKLKRDGTVESVVGEFGEGKGFSGDGGPARQAKLNYNLQGAQINDIFFGPDESLYIADTFNNRIRKVGLDGIINTIVGDGQTCFFGIPCVDPDGKTGIETSIKWPVAVAADRHGNVYFIQEGASTVRMLRPHGIVSHLVAGPNAMQEGMFANQVHLTRPSDIAIGPDDSVYIADPFARKIYRVDPSGRIYTFAGTGDTANSGDGGLATEAGIGRADHLFVDAKGNVYFNSGVIRKVDTNGIISTVVGVEVQSAGGGGFAGSVKLSATERVVVNNDGDIFLIQVYRPGIAYRVRDALPGFMNQPLRIASEDGSELYEFERTGRHVRTLNALTNSVKYQFSYDNQGRLVAVIDAFGAVTTFDRNAQQDSIQIIAPDGQMTTLTLNDNGYLAKVRNPANELIDIQYGAGGLMQQYRDARGNASIYHYDGNGLLIEEINAAGGGWTLDAVAGSQNKLLDTAVTMTSGEGRATVFDVKMWNNGDELRQVLRPDGTRQSQTKNARGEDMTISPDGTVLRIISGADPRFLMQSPVPAVTEIELPSGLKNRIDRTVNAQLSNPSDPFSLVELNSTYTINGKTYTNRFDVQNRTWSRKSPTGREAAVVLDEFDRPLISHFPGLSSTQSEYDARGRLTALQIGEGIDARITTFTFHESGPSKGRLHTVTDALDRTVSYEYDLAGRVTRQILPDMREISYGYDANGNLTSITPPGRPAHQFTFTPVDLGNGYTPPDVLPGVDATDYAYNLDKQLELVTRPDGQTIDFVYGQMTGKLDEIIVPNGSYQFDYNATTGQLESLIAPGGEQLSYSHDGFLTTGVASAGTINGTVGYSYNDDFRLQSLSINGQAVSFTYDNDGLLTGAGALVLSRDTANGLLDTTSLGVVITDNDVSSFGELGSFSAAVSGSDVYSVDYQRDKLGRITQKTETIQGIATVSDYTYDLAGRLDTVSENDVVVRDYDYDSNGNRIAINGITVGSYDNQDRLLSYNSCTYQYTANGELDTRDCTDQVLDVDYDVLGNLRTATLPNGDVIDYVIDGQNRRIGKKVNGTLVQGFLYQDQLNPVAELDGSGNVIARFIYADKANVPAYMIKGGNTYRIVSDHLGSPRLVINVADGSIAQRLDYDEWGNVAEDTNPGFQPFGFAGGIHDRDTGLIRFGARDYSPEIGRWASKDPIGFQGDGTNLYGYVLSDPINFYDQNGQWLHVAAGAALGAAFGAANAYISGGDVLGGAISGGIQGGLAGLTMGASLSTSLSVGVGTSLASELLSQSTSGCWDGFGFFNAAVAGAAGGLLGGAYMNVGAGKMVATFASGMVSGGIQTGGSAVHQSQKRRSY